MDKIFINQGLADHLIKDRKRERPELDASAMEIVGRNLRLGKVPEKRAGKAGGVL